MSYDKAEKVSTGSGALAIKVLLCMVYAAACVIAENTVMADEARTQGGLVVTAVVAVPLIICALIFALWWRTADEFQRLIEYRACAIGGLGGVFFLVVMKLASYFLPAISHIPSLSIIGMVLIYWVSNSHNLNAKALKP